MYTINIFLQIIILFLIGIVFGFIVEMIYRSATLKKFVKPKYINIQMYGLMGAFLPFLHWLHLPVIAELFLLFTTPTVIEFITGYIYLKNTGIYLWDYSKEKYNFMKIICLRFSLAWFGISILVYYLFVYTI